MRNSLQLSHIFSQPTLTVVWMLFLMSTGLLCAQNPSTAPVSCSAIILKADEEYGKKRNHDPKEVPLEQAIHTYIYNLRQLDFSACPDEFTRLFFAHIQAWEELIPLTIPYSDLRGEMHELFSLIEKGNNANSFNSGVRQIWDTWNSLELWMTENEK